MLHAKRLPFHFWAKATNTTCHIHNRVVWHLGTHLARIMKYGGEENPMSNIFIFLEVRVISSRQRSQKKKMGLQI